MKQIDRRLKTLEATMHVASWSDRLAGVHELSQGKLSATDLDLLAEVNALLNRGGGQQLSEAQEGVWNRWNAALAQGTEELKFPVSLAANDWRL